MNANPEPFFGYQFVEDSQNFLPVGIHLPEGVAEAVLIPLWLEPFVQHGAGNVNIPAEGIGGMTTQKKTVKHGRLPLWGQGIQFLASDHPRILVSPYRTTKANT